jgi:hypothetical protein
LSPAQEPRYKTRPGKWYTPPPGTPLYSAIPRATRQYWALLTKAEQALLRLICDSRWAKQAADKSWKATPPGMSELAAELEVDRSTVIRGYRALVQKHCIQQSFEYYRGTRKYRGKRVYVYSFAEALDRRRRDPEVALTNDKRVVFRGRGRRPMTPADAHAWKVQLDRVPEFDEADSAELELELEPEADNTTVIDVDSPAVVEMPAAPERSDTDPILAALQAVVTAGAASASDAAEAYRSVADNTIPRETVAEWIRDLGESRRRINPSQLLSPGYFVKQRRDGSAPLQAYVTKHRQAQYRAEQERRKAESIERDRRVNSLAELIRQHDTATDPVERAQLAEFFGTAAPDELAAARDAIGAARSRAG